MREGAKSKSVSWARMWGETKLAKWWGVGSNIEKRKLQTQDFAGINFLFAHQYLSHLNANFVRTALQCTTIYVYTECSIKNRPCCRSISCREK